LATILHHKNQQHTVRHQEEFRQTWCGGALTKKKMQELLQGLFSSCLNHGCVRTNTAKLPSNSASELIQVHAIHA
jgi:hypothetical protein